MDLLGIKKDAFYEDLKFLSIKMSKDADRKSFLSAREFEMLVKLRDHVETTGKRDGFDEEAEIMATPADLVVRQDEAIAKPQPRQDDYSDQLDELMRGAMELRAQQLATPQMIMGALADRLSYEDLPADLQQRVQAANPTPPDPEAIAGKLMRQWQRRQAS